jgi:3-methylcrotonyl-CoA carboxylase alpha subunit
MHSHSIATNAPAPHLGADGRHQRGTLSAVIDITPETVEVRSGGQTHSFARQAPRKAEDSSSSGELRAPMPGRVLSLDVAEGAHVEAGQRLAILEAMKMEHQLKSPASGTVTGLAIAAGDQVAEGMLLLEITPVADHSDPPPPSR